MSKALVCEGYETTTGGRVIAKIATMFENGRRIALDRERATCGNCPGEHPIEATGIDMSENGRASVLDDDKVLCTCGKNHVKAPAHAGCFVSDASADAR
jgi:uncharacterized Zn-binding protein involved in type VI secretion